MNTIRGDNRDIVRLSLFSAFLYPGFTYFWSLKNQMAAFSLFFELPAKMAKE